MERVIEALFDRFLKEVFGEGERRIKIELLYGALEAVRGVRRLFLLAYVFCFSCFLSSTSFFATGYLAVEQWQAVRAGHFDPRLIFCFAVWLASTAFLASSVRERRWAGAFRLQEKINELERSKRTSGLISEAELVSLINKVLEEKLGKSTQTETDHAA